MSETLSSPEIKKPELLYHASSDTEITKFDPHDLSVRDKDEGPVVFGTPYEALASCFITRTDDSWASSGYINGTPYMLISDEERYRLADKGGAIYILPNATFETNPSLGLGVKEWTSKAAVEPINKKLYNSALVAMLEHGVQVYFTNINTLHEFRSMIERRQDLGGYMNSLVSENQKLDTNIKNF